jgi:hypothetical protein
MSVIAATPHVLRFAPTGTCGAEYTVRPSRMDAKNPTGLLHK